MQVQAVQMTISLIDGVLLWKVKRKDFFSYIIVISLMIACDGQWFMAVTYGTNNIWSVFYRYETCGRKGIAGYATLLRLLVLL